MQTVSLLGGGVREHSRSRSGWRDGFVALCVRFSGRLALGREGRKEGGKQGKKEREGKEDCYAHRC